MRNMCGHEVAARKYTPRGISISSLGDEHVLQQQRARDGAAHAQRVPVADHRHAFRAGGDRQVERVAARGGVALAALGAEHPIVVGGTRERGEDLLAADEEAAVDRLRLGAEGDAAGGRGTAFGEGLRVDGAVADDALVVQAAALVVLGALLGGHDQVIGQRTGPQRRGDVHVPGQRGGSAVAAELGGGEAVGAVAGADAAVRRRHADGEQAFLVHVAEVLDRERGGAIVLGGAVGEHTRAEAARVLDQVGFAASEPERGRIEDRRVVVGRTRVRGAHRFGCSRMRKRLAQETEDGRVEFSRRLQVRQVPDVRKAHVAGPGDLPCHALDHRRGSIGILLAR